MIDPYAAGIVSVYFLNNFETIRRTPVWQQSLLVYAYTFVQILMGKTKRPLCGKGLK